MPLNKETEPKLIMADIYLIFLLEMEIYCQDRFSKLSLLTNLFLLNIIYYWNKLPNQIKTSVKSFKNKLDYCRKYVKKKNLRGLNCPEYRKL